MTIPDHLASIIAGAVMALLAVLVIGIIAQGPVEAKAPMTNEQLIQSARHCEKNGLAIRVKLATYNRPAKAWCGTK